MGKKKTKIQVESSTSVVQVGGRKTGKEKINKKLRATRSPSKNTMRRRMLIAINTGDETTME